MGAGATEALIKGNGEVNEAYVICSGREIPVTEITGVEVLERHW